MSLLKFIKAQFGISNTPTNNFTLDASAQDGTMKLSRGNAGATTQDVMVVDAAGKVTMPQGIGSVGGLPAFQCRAWVNFDGTRNAADTGASVNGQAVKILSSGNISSVTKVSVGKYTIVFSVPMPDKSYAISGAAAGVSGQSYSSYISSTASASKTAGQVEITVPRINAGVANDPFDSADISAMFFR